ncbi:hypothetical protein ABZ770_32280 [Streptomyces sp. NPDC006654]|uniref:hypothetical protein n=1 Tax=Streptomyces sp. NPDC006654 TaxID=3156897 RepID=UPI0033F442AF
MPRDSATGTDWSRYAKQASADLEEIRRRQRELTRQLDALHREESLLQNILNLAGHPSGAPATPPAPAQSEDEPVASPDLPVGAPVSVPPAAGTGIGAGLTRAVGAGARKKPREAGQDNTKIAAKQPRRQDFLGDLLLGLLRSHREPRLAAELREELLRTYPERNPTPQVVRNTLESLVAKGRVERHRQDRSVLYTPADDDLVENDAAPEDYASS